MRPDDGIFLARCLSRRLRPSRAEMLEFQARRLRALVEHAYRRVPFYRDLFDRHGLRPEDIRGLADLPRVPITSRGDLQAASPDRLVARGLNPQALVCKTTSGSSGEPLTIRRSAREVRAQGAARLPAVLDVGRRPRDRGAIVTSLRASDPLERKRLLRALRRVGLFREIRVNCRQPPEAIAQILEAYRPHVVSGLAGAISRVAELVGGDPSRRLRPRLVTTAGEVLTRSMRAQIAEGLRTRVVDLYTSHEFNLIAWECEAGEGYHTCDMGVIVEVIRDGRPAAPGERGEMVVSGLHSFCMPFLRYRLGDLVTRGPDSCPCGQPFSVLRAIQGRMIDYFPLPDGRLVHPYEVVRALTDGLGPWVRQYQLTQEREDRVVLRVAPSRPLPPERLAALEQTLAGVLGPTVSCSVDVVTEIDLERNGKFRVSRSLVRSAYDRIDWDRV
jgi:phenylacetate-CoA ligase